MTPLVSMPRLLRAPPLPVRTDRNVLPSHPDELLGRCGRAGRNVRNVPKCDFGPMHALSLALFAPRVSVDDHCHPRRDQCLRPPLTFTSRVSRNPPSTPCFHLGERSAVIWPDAAVRHLCTASRDSSHGCILFAGLHWCSFARRPGRAGRARIACPHMRELVHPNLCLSSEIKFGCCMRFLVFGC